MTKKKQKQKIILPPELPPEVKEEDIDVSDEDLEFVNENRDYAGFVSRLDTASITRQVTRVADLEGDELEAAYEKRLKKKALKQKLKQEDESRIEVDRVDALPVKTLDGKLHYRTVSRKPEDGDDEKDSNAAGGDKGLTKLTKPEKRAKLKRSKKEAKQQEKDLEKDQEVEQAPQTAVLAEIQEDLTAEELFERKKLKLAELGIALLADPESNIKSLKEMFQFCKDADHSIVKLGLLSLLAVFKDIIPGYRIRLPTEKELEMKISKEIKKMRFYESTLLSTYKAYLQKLMVLAKDSKFKHVATRCVCTLLEAVPHFNFRESLMDAVVENIGSPDHIIRKLCCGAIKSLFTNEGKHGGEATVEAVQLIAGHVKARDCLLHADSVEVFLSLSFDEDLGKHKEEEKERGGKYKKYKKRKNGEEPLQLQENDRKRSKKEMMTRMSEEVAADYKAAAFTPDVKELRRRQVETLSAVFETYFRILRHTLQSTIASSKNDGNLAVDASGNHPLLAPCLNGLGKFSHLIDMDYIGDLMNYLKKLAGGDSSSEKPYKCLSISERLKCCIVAFKVMKINLDALNVDLQGFFVLLYNLILEYRPGRDQGDVLAEALKVMLFEDRQQDMQKAAAFAKRLATFSLCFGSAEAMAAMVTLKSILQKNVKCRNLLENDAGGGSVSGIIAKYQPFASDPNLSGALASVLWELNLLSEHFHPAISTMASSISSMSASHNQVYISLMSPQQAFAELSLQRELLNPKYDVRKSNNKKRKGSSKKVAAVEINQDATSADEDKLRKKLSDHFVLLRDVKENERLRCELDRTTLALQLYDEYTKQKKLKKRA
ncbi:nucleolar complex-associated protein 3 [Mercurialis annua]|uniref:nucleolar complex-associated protein 3 n=1 Tax=Mercurialis annua TaxID=3986 RepID=UPI00215FC902|nr:nucleolar complex-associated protein 3 [Mercurialis annua]